ncbi:MAG: TRAP transporter TatT component family protein [Pyrinomonadaceae bacterium]
MKESHDSEIMKLADELYAKRKEVQSVRASVAMLISRPATANDYDIQWRLGRALFFLGQEATDKTSSLLRHSQGIEFCERAVAEQADRVEGHFWLGVNLALSARWERWPAAMRRALHARRELQRAIDIDSSYHAAGPLRVLARLQQKVPRWLGGGVSRARASYESAIALAPENTVTRVYFVELLIDLGEQELARKHLEFVLSVAEDPDWSFEIERDKRLAKGMLGKL